MNILIVTSEFVPLAKAGGLADAVASLAAGLAARDHHVDVVMPKYKHIDTAPFSREPEPLSVELGDGVYGCAVLTGTISGVTIHLLEHEALYRRDGVYGPTAADSHPDNLRRFALLSRGALEFARLKALKPEILHVHDWPSSLAAIYLHSRYSSDPVLGETRSILTIHNLGFQGVFPYDEARGLLGLSPEEMEIAGLSDEYGVNLLRGAILSSDRVVTVSPTYAREIQQPRYGCGLHSALQVRGPHLSGILNGIDTNIWNPDQDPYIPARYNVNDMGGKEICKEQLQEELDLPVDSQIPLIGMVTRLTAQKGIEELFGQDGCAERILSELPLQWVVLGTGEPWCEDRVRSLSYRYGNFVGLTMYSDTLAHRIEAGCDFFLMPSRYEPCGLNQMYSMRYGTIPIVTRTGGLSDTVDSKSGFHIEELSSSGIFRALEVAAKRYREQPQEILQMRRHAMTRDFSIAESTIQHERLYREAISEAR